jgi:peptide/nickel transport system permease protein
VGALFFYSMPSFLLGVVVFYLFFYRLHLAGVGWFPGNGYVPFTHSPLRWAQHLILPWFTLALVTAAAYARLTRGSMLDVLGEDYIRTARAKGLTERRVVYKHGLRSALTPVVTQFGIDFGTLLGGVIIVENIFGLQGLGQQAVQSVLQQDLPVVIGTIVVAAAFIVLANIVVDIVYGILDPRVRVH